MVDIREPNRFVSGPHLAWQAHAAGQERTLPFAGDKLVRRIVPGLLAFDHLVLFVDNPQGPDLPIESLAEHIENFTPGGLGSFRLGQRQRHRVFGGETPGGALPVADIAIALQDQAATGTVVDQLESTLDVDRPSALGDLLQFAVPFTPSGQLGFEGRPAVGEIRCELIVTSFAHRFVG
jgi:hypothetical protein